MRGNALDWDTYSGLAEGIRLGQSGDKKKAAKVGDHAIPQPKRPSLFGVPFNLTAGGIYVKFTGKRRDKQKPS